MRPELSVYFTSWNKASGFNKLKKSAMKVKQMLAEEIVFFYQP